MDDTQAVRNFTYGGPNPALSQFALNVRQMVSYLPGNIDLLAGLGPQSQTATQDELLSVAANRRVGRMQSRIVGFIREIFESVAWHCWYNPDARVPITKTIPGTDISLSQVWSPDPNEADFLEFQFRFDPYSLQNLTPVQRAQLIRSLFREDIMPMLPLLIQQGQMPDVVGYLTEVGKLLNIEVDKLIQMQPAQPPQQGQGAPGLLEKSPTSTRHYVRHNRPGMTRQGADAATGLALIGMARDQSANQRQTQVQEA